MKNYSVTFFFVLFTTWFTAQTVGINTTGAVPATSAMLDVSATNKGLLIPRVDIVNLATAAPVTAPVTSLLVYNINVTSGVGYYFWDGTSWIQLLDVSSTIEDHDWYKETTTSAPTIITDDIFTEGKVRISTPNYPPLKTERTATGTSSIAGVLQANQETTGDMVDGFGVRIDFTIEDNAGVENEIAHIGAVRDGADNSGRLQFWTENAGVDAIKMIVKPSGKVGIGMVSPRGRLEINHDVSSEYSAVLFNTQDVAGNGLLIESNGGSDDDTLIYAIGDLNGTPVDKFILLGDARVGINHSTPNVLTKLDVNGYHIGQVFSFSGYSTNTVANYSNGSLIFTEIEDINSNYDGTEYTAPVDGLYYFSTNVTFVGGDGDDDTQFLRFLKNSATAVNSLIINPEYYTIAGVEVPYSNSCLVRLIAGETIEVDISDVNGASPVCDYSYRSFMGYFVSK